MMSQNDEKIVGILGGMGPEATVDLMQRIIRLTPALDDIDHIRCIVDNNPKVPSRIRAIIDGDGEDPGPCMADMGKRLENFGADFLAIACNTAHFYYEAVQEAVNIPVLNLIELVSNHIKEKSPQQGKVGILASPAVSMTGLYKKYLTKLDIEDVWPDSEYQEILFNVIKSVKKGELGPTVQMNYETVCEHLKSKGVSSAIVACTELSALRNDLPITTVDAAHILATKIVQMVKNV